MPDTNVRIEQFRKMATDDPTNELAHYSLGRAYLDAGILDGAIASFQRVLDLKPDMSPAYRLLATALIARGQKDLAIEQLTKGVKVAHDRGDIMPRNDMVKMLQDLGAPVPQLGESHQDRLVGPGEVMCVRCGRVGPKLARQPFRNVLGQEIVQKVCQTCWREWIAMGTKVINELRLPLSEPAAQKVYDQHLKEFLNLAGEDRPA